ncbi:MAG: ribosome-binding factor A [Candidatus Liptonbacteria bacterium]|nr:ribosome-binding factor A [Candidatus Liptonbacteria bacterium]
MNHRPERVGKLIREQLSGIIARELEFENILVTITEVEVDKKLETAKTRISVWPAEKSKDALNALNKARNFLQTALFKKLNIRPMPNIWFELDRGPEHAAGVEKALLEEDNS